MEPTSWVVSRNLRLDLIDPSGDSCGLDGELEYHSGDPYAVVAVFRAGATAIRWVFARDLLAEGLYSPAGDGDVHIWPCLDSRGTAVVMIELVSPHGEALLQAASLDVSEFLQHTFELVPRGAEDMELDLDHVVLRLLSDGADADEHSRHDTAG